MKIDLSAYPKRFKLRDGREVVVRTLKKSDEAALIRLMNELPPNERVYFRDDVADPEVIHKWVHQNDLKKTIPLLALDGDNVVANWTLHHGEHGWVRHRAHIRGIVAVDWRQQGLGIHMVRDLLKLADSGEIEQVVIELVKPQEGLLKRYTNLGFVVEAVLKNWVKDFDGRYHDLTIMSMKVEPAWRKMEAMIANYGTHGG